MCDRSSDPTEHDAARERPSALDVGSLSDFMAFVEREAGGLPYNLDHWLRLYFARLTEPNAGEGTERPAGSIYPFIDKYDDSYQAPTPDTAEATLDHIAWAQAIRSEHEATHGEAEQCGAECIALGLAAFEDDTTEATLRAAAQTLVEALDRHGLDNLALFEQQIATVRAALQQSAVQLEHWPRWECSACRRNANQCDVDRRCCSECNHDYAAVQLEGGPE